MAAAAAPLPPTPRPNRLSIDIISVAFRHNSIEHISFLQRKGLLAISITCSCGTQMALGEKSDLSDGHIFDAACVRQQSLYVMGVSSVRAN